ncbi:GNAT family N-acetyltransferase [Shimia sp. MMG029]|uniref:GNAT family N-acetyltransferase n=1 Tax=Shimia sp. MMG029 TaxID=3021978 RepID=UPI0022FE501B|nr:GNAT family N-acetyltransferase [Shimia sp. MMG029]MDA5556565.1 GNAT family N-acetyltransferase [Shimia sp. MMG029]
MIRPLTPEDLEAYKALWIHGLTTEPEAFLLTAAEAAGALDSSLIAKLASGAVIGAFEGTALVGFVAMHQGGPERLHHMADIGPLYIHPSARRRGLGRDLMCAVIDAAKTRGFLQLELCVDATNTGARALYEAQGFAQFGLRPRSVIVNGVPRDDVLMLKPLD